MRKNVFKKALTLTTALALTATLASCNNNSHNGVTTEGVMVVGMECAYQPFNWTEAVSNDFTVKISNQTNAYADGYDIQMAKKIASELNLKLEVKALDWDGLITSLNAGEIDMIIAGMSNTAERRESIDFTNGYYTSEEVLLVKADSKYASATGLHDFEGAKIAGQLGTLYADFALQAKTKVNSIYDSAWNLATVGDIMNEININKIDATVLELPVAQGIVAANPEYKIIRLDENDTFEANPEDVEVCIGIRKNFELKDQINNILANISKSERDELMSQAVTRAGSSN